MIVVYITFKHVSSVAGKITLGWSSIMIDFVEEVEVVTWLSFLQGNRREFVEG